jgi:gamma-glutamyl-gamma-aminobutyrate hydrolase PuuD
MRKVLIVNSSAEYVAMFIQQQGWHVTNSLDEADLVQFTGGSDVSPYLYGEKEHPRTYAHKERDLLEVRMFERCLEFQKPMAGICRGGQFLNVMNEGTMYQDVNNHAMTGTHGVKDLYSQDVYQATSTHHQMMRPSKKGLILAIASPPLATRKEYVDDGNIKLVTNDHVDVEAVYYPKSNCLCFQPHPEFRNGMECREHYFRYIEDYIFKGDK